MKLLMTWELAYLSHCPARMFPVDVLYHLLSYVQAHASALPISVLTCRAIARPAAAAAPHMLTLYRSSTTQILRFSAPMSAPRNLTSKAIAIGYHHLINKPATELYQHCLRDFDANYHPCQADCRITERLGY